ncbi:MAG: TolC family protein [bacterium]|nr:MAG: TolC family protein [bacterium]
MLRIIQSIAQSTPFREIRSTCAIILVVIVVTASVSAFEAQAGGNERAFDLADSLEHEYRQEQIALRGFTLKDYLTYAALNNSGLKAFFYNWKAELERSTKVSSLPDPVFTYSYFIEHVETRVGPQNHKFTLKQAFPWFGTLGAKGDVALETANAAYEEFRSEKLKLFYDVKRAYIDYYVLGREIEITRANITLLKYWESVARTKYKAALQKHQDIIKVQVELGKLEDRLLTLEEMKIPTAARLRQVLDLSGTIELPVPEKLEDVEPSINFDNLKSDIIQNNPILKAVAHLIFKEEAAVKLAGKESLPKFMIGIDYIQTGESVDPAMIDSGKDPLILNASITLPIWFGKNKANKDQAKARLEMARYNHRNKKNGLLALAEKIIFEYRDAARRVELYRDGLIPKAEQSLNSSFTAYQAGETDFLNVIDAQRQLIDFQLQLEYALTNKATKLAEIEMLAGREML